MTDSSTSEGWAKKSNFTELIEDPVQAEVRIEVCRKDAKRNLEYNLKDYSQWFPGAQNDVADALSRDHDRTDEELTYLLFKFCPSQMPKPFKIAPLPAEISSYLISVLQKLPVKKQLREKHTRTKIGRGPDGKSIAFPLDLKKISTWTASPEATESNSWEPLPWLCVRGGIRDHLMVPWLRAQSEVPFHLYLRPSGRMIDPIQQKMKTGTLEEFYQDSSGPSGTETLTQCNKKPYQPKY